MLQRHSSRRWCIPASRSCVLRQAPRQAPFAVNVYRPRSAKLSQFIDVFNNTPQFRKLGPGFRLIDIHRCSFS
jgi:hypothetical protein